MKPTIFTIITLLLFTVTTGFAQKYFPDYSHYQKANLALAEKNYSLCLESSNDGIVMSALAHIGRIKLYFPDRPFPVVEQKICELSTSSQSPEIRYRAFLICNLMKSPALFTSEAMTEFENSEALFNALNNRLGETMLGSNGTH